MKLAWQYVDANSGLLQAQAVHVYSDIFTNKATCCHYHTQET